MNKKLLLISVAFQLLMGLSSSSCAQTYSDTDFWFGYLNNYDDATSSYQIHVTASTATTGTVTIPLASPAYTSTFSVGANSVYTIVLPEAKANHRGISDAISNRGVHLQLSNPCVVYLGNYLAASSDAAIAMPTSALGSSYHVVAYGDKSYTNPSEFIIIGTQDATTVTIKLSQASVNKAAGSTQTITLNKGQTYHVKSKGTIGAGTGGATWSTDLTGSTVTATAPVAVYAGNWCGVVGGCSYCDHMFEQQRPTTTWGTEFYLAPTDKGSLTADRLRVYAATAGTVVNLNGAALPSMAAKTYTDVDLASGVYLTSNNPVLVTQMLRGSMCSAPPLQIDPLILDILPTAQYGYNYICSTSSYARYTGGHYATVVIPTANIASLRLNGAVLGASASFTSITGSTYSYGYIPLSPASIYTVSSVSATPFGLYIYGYGVEESYGYTAGGYLMDLTVPLPIKLLSYSAIANQTSKEVQINWTSIEEKDNSYYELEHSSNGISFEAIAKKSCNGFTGLESKYSFIHKSPSIGTNFYRLKQYTFNGKSSVADIKTAIINGKQQSLGIQYATLDASNEKLHVSYSSENNSPVSIAIYDILGRNVSLKSTNIEPSYIEFDTASLPKGTYLVTIEQQSTSLNAQAKFVK